jgi:hypothetical protein
MQKEKVIMKKRGMLNDLFFFLLLFFLLPFYFFIEEPPPNPLLGKEGEFRVPSPFQGEGGQPGVLFQLELQKYFNNLLKKK